jgi:hypothetical protein
MVCARTRTQTPPHSGLSISRSGGSYQMERTTDYRLGPVVDSFGGLGFLCIFIIPILHKSTSLRPLCDPVPCLCSDCGPNPENDEAMDPWETYERL